MIPYNFISLGWGIQSFCLALMSAYGDLPKVEYAIFADTGYEKKKTMEYREKYEPLLNKLGLKTITVYGNKREDFVEIPAYYNKRNQGSRQCTSNWKIRPIHSFIFHFLRDRKIDVFHGKVRANIFIGITYEEFYRMRDGNRKYIKNIYPFVDMKMTRDDCVKYLSDKGIYEIPPKSSCVFCPFQNTRDFRLLSDEDKKIAIEYDNKIRKINKNNYISRKLIPLSELLESNIEEHSIKDDSCNEYCFV